MTELVLREVSAFLINRGCVCFMSTNLKRGQYNFPKTLAPPHDIFGMLKNFRFVKFSVKHELTILVCNLISENLN